MKKIIGVAFAFVIAASALFAGPFGDLLKTTDSLTGKKSEAVSGKIPEGKKLLPVLWQYVNDNSELPPKVVASGAVFTGIDPIANEYSFVQSVVFKFGIGLQKQESKILVKSDGQDFSVVTVSMVTGNVDKDGKWMGSPNENAAKALTQNSKNIAAEIEKIAKSITDAKYSENLNAALTSTLLLDSVATKTPLVFKKFIADNEIVGRKTSMKVEVVTVDESRVKGFAYRISGSILRGKGTDVGVIIVTILTNNDEALSLSQGSSYTVNGVIKELTRGTLGGLGTIDIEE